MRMKPFWILLAALTLAAASLGAQASETGTSLPILDPRSDGPVDLKFSEPTPVVDIYRALGKAWGVDFLFDPKFRNREIAIELNGVTAREGFDNLLRTAGNFHVVVDPHTVLIADDTPQNRRTYEHQVVQRFYLENTEVRDMMTLVRSLIGAKHIAGVETSNSLILRDTAAKLRVAEQIVRRNDRPRAEVVIDVDLLVVDRQAMHKLGLKPAAEHGAATAGVPARLGKGEIDRLRSLDSTRALARPRLDVVANSTAELRLTDSLPIPGGTTSPEVVYQEVGLQVKLQPWVHSREEVTLRIEIAADTLTDWVVGPGGEERPVFGNINLKSKVRLRAGETYLMTGLMIVPDRIGGKKGGFPYGRFLREADSGSEIVLALTPHVVRGPGVEAGDLLPLWIGTESNINLDGGSLRAGSDHVAGVGGTEDVRLR